jgi:hypothetical protein
MSAAGAASEQDMTPARTVAYYQCDYCNKKAELQCSRCKAAVFCNKECLKKAWPKHKKNCVAKGAIPIDGKQMQEAIFALQILDKKNVGKLSGTSMFNVIGSFLGLDPAVGPEGIPKAQQQFMKSDRIPTFLAACSGSYDVIIAESGEVLKDSIRDLVDGTIMYVKYGRGKLRDKRSPEFRYHSPGSLAAELYAVCNGRLATFKYIEGGILYMIGQAELFWSMVMHYREKGSVLPLSKAGVDVETTFYAKELERVYVSGMSNNLNASRASPTSLRSESLAFCQHMAQGSDIAPHPIMDLIEGMPNRQQDKPLWWTVLAEFWDTHLARCGMPAGREIDIYENQEAAAAQPPVPSIYTQCPRPTCMFFCCPPPEGFGCGFSHEGRPCTAWHDEHYLRAQLDIRRIEAVVHEGRAAQTKEWRNERGMDIDGEQRPW